MNAPQTPAVAASVESELLRKVQLSPLTPCANIVTSKNAKKPSEIRMAAKPTVLNRRSDAYRFFRRAVASGVAQVEVKLLISLPEALHDIQRDNVEDERDDKEDKAQSKG